MKYLSDLFGIELKKFDIKHQTYTMEVYWTDDNASPVKLFELTPTWRILNDTCGYFYPRVGKLLLVQKDRKERTICETEFDFDSRRFYETAYFKNRSVETLFHFNRYDEHVIEQRLVNIFRDGKRVATSYIPVSCL